MSSSSLPSTQSVWRWTGAKEVASSLRLDSQAAVPKLSPGHVLIRVRAVSLNFRDLLIVRGQYPLKTVEQGIPVSDGAGEVVAVDPSVYRFAVGDRVVASFSPDYVGGSPRFTGGLAHALGGDINGMLAQYVMLHHSALVKLPPSISFEEASTLPCAGVTAYNALYSGIEALRPDHTVLVEGTGGVSMLAAQLALSTGARVLVTSSSDAKLARVRELLQVPAGDCINYTATPEWGAKAKELTGGLGVDHVIEVGGPNTVQQAVKATRIGGEVDVIGMVGGFKGENLDVISVLFGAVTVRGVIVGSREHLQRLVDHVDRCNIKPIVDKVFPFAQALDAYQYLEAQKHIGKVVIRID